MENSISDVESNGSKAHFKMLFKWFINIDYSERNGVLWLSESEALTVRQQLSLLDFRMTWKELCEAWRRFDNLICFAELVPVHVFDFIFVAFNWTRKWTVAHGISNKYTNSKCSGRNRHRKLIPILARTARTAFVTFQMNGDESNDYLIDSYVVLLRLFVSITKSN